MMLSLSNPTLPFALSPLCNHYLTCFHLSRACCNAPLSHEPTPSTQNGHTIIYGQISHVSVTPSLNAFRNMPRVCGRGNVVLTDREDLSFTLLLSHDDNDYGQLTNLVVQFITRSNAGLTSPRKGGP